jgi:hypothetical protein
LIAILDNFPLATLKAFVRRGEKALFNSQE